MAASRSSSPPPARRRHATTHAHQRTLLHLLFRFVAEPVTGGFCDVTTRLVAPTTACRLQRVKAPPSQCLPLLVRRPQLPLLLVAPHHLLPPRRHRCCPYSLIATPIPRCALPQLPMLPPRRRRPANRQMRALPPRTRLAGASAAEKNTITHQTAQVLSVIRERAARSGGATRERPGRRRTASMLLESTSSQNASGSACAEPIHSPSSSTTHPRPIADLLRRHSQRRQREALCSPHAPIVALQRAGPCCLRSLSLEARGSARLGTFSCSGGRDGSRWHESSAVHRRTGSPQAQQRLRIRWGSAVTAAAETVGRGGVKRSSTGREWPARLHVCEHGAAQRRQPVPVVIRELQYPAAEFRMKADCHAPH